VQHAQASSNPFDSVFSGGETASNTEQTTPQQPSSGWEFASKAHQILNSDEGGLQKAWDIANTPLLDLKRNGATGIEAGVEDVLTGLTSPLSAGLTLATAGAGGLLDAAGIDVAKMAGPQVMQAAKVAGKLATAGFTAQQIKGIADASPAFRQAWENGDTSKALEIGTSMVLNAGMAGFGAKHALADTALVGNSDTAQSTVKDQLVGKYQGDLKATTNEAQKFTAKFKNDVKDQTTRNALQLYTEAGGASEAAPEDIQAKLADWAQKITDSDNVAPKLKKQVLADLGKAQDLSDDEKAKAQDLREFYDNDFVKAHLKKLLGDESYRKNYIARARWDRETEDENDAETPQEILGDTSQDHTQKRVFDTTVDGILQGNKPKMNGNRFILDAADLAGDYHRAMGKAIARTDFVERALATKNEAGSPLAVKGGVVTKFPETMLDDNGNKVETGKINSRLDSNAIADSPLTRQEATDLFNLNRLQDQLDSGVVKDLGPREEGAEETEPDDDNHLHQTDVPIRTTDVGDGMTETEYHPGQEVPAPESELGPTREELMKQLPETLRASMDDLKAAADAHANLVNNPVGENHESAVRASDDQLQTLRNKIEDSLDGIGKLPKGVRAAAKDYLKETAPSPLDHFNGGYYRGRYRYNTDGYVNDIRSRYAKGTAYGGTPNSFMNAPIAFHPDLVPQARLILAPKTSKFFSNKYVKGAMDLSTQAKQSLLNLSGFHWTQIGLRGIESGINPIKPLLDMKDNAGGWDMSNPRHKALVNAGGIQPGIEQGSALAEGLQGHGPLSKIPVVGQWLDNVNNALFSPNGYIDRMKLNAALNFEERLRKTNPEMGDSTRYKVAGQLANQRFGGLNYLAMGRSQTARDIMRAALLAPDWLESNFRDALSTMGPAGKISRNDVARIALYNFAAAQTLNLLNTGKMQLDQPFGVVSKDGKKVYTVRTMPSDIAHALMDPRDYINNRLNPMVTRTALEALTGRDKQGHVRDMGQQIADLAQNVVPIPVQGLLNKMVGNVRYGEGVSDAALSALGATTRVNNTPAEELAYKMASQNSSMGAPDTHQMAHIQRVMGYEDRLRQGDRDAVRDINNDVQDNQLAPADVRQILKAAKQTRLQAIVNRLPMDQALDVWDKATNDEREQLHTIMAKKMISYRRTESQKLTPGERGPMDVKLAKVYNDMHPDVTAAE
jgi:hypothetical protein